MSLLIISLICLTAYPRIIKKYNKKMASFSAKDSVIVDGRKIYFSCSIDSLLVFKDKTDGEFHIFDKCSCIDNYISAHYLCDINPLVFKKNLCPLCESKCKFIKTACDSLILRKH